jgi:hypothetical protein
MKQEKKVEKNQEKTELTNIENIDNTDNIIKPKRGRKSKKDLILSLNMSETIPTAIVKKTVPNPIPNPNPNPNSIPINMEINIKEIANIKGLNEDIIDKQLDLDNNEDNDSENVIINMVDNNNNDNVKNISKKRGRKPKGGKIIQHLTQQNNEKKNKPNIILHLKCYLKELNLNNQNNNIESYNFCNKNDLTYEIINNNVNTNNTNTVETTEYEVEEDYSKDNQKELWKKIKQLENNLHINNISDKKSACFWCTYDFDNPPIYIPKFFLKNTYHVYGCFCSPECGTAFLMEENIDSSTKFERYHFINHLYAKIYNYEKNIKPAPNPYYMLDKYYGNLSIQEYRSLFKNERLFLIVDKPLTRVLPELHEDNDDFILNNKIIPSNNYNIKRKLLNKNQNKVNILNEQFGITN